MHTQWRKAETCLIDNSYICLLKKIVNKKHSALILRGAARKWGFKMYPGKEKTHEDLWLIFFL